MGLWMYVKTDRQKINISCCIISLKITMKSILKD